MNYEEFLAGKAPRVHASGIEPGQLPPGLAEHAAAITRWAIRRGRAAIFADTGLHKTRMQLAWLARMPRPGHIFAPLGVTQQTIEEARVMGLELRFAEGSREVGDGLTISNYEKRHRFDPSAYQALALDESSILKSVDGKTRTALLRDWTCIPYRLACTATPAPNDIAELANHAEFLGIMSRAEMLATFFVHDDSTWRLKGHAVEAFYRWLATWAVYVRRPSDLGFSDEGFELPRLTITDERVAMEYEPGDGQLFPALAGGVTGRALARRQSIGARVARAAEIIRNRSGQWLVWCGLNDEGRDLGRALGAEWEDYVLIEGADDDEAKLARLNAWRSGRARTLISKLSIFGFGMNFQHCHQMLFLGLGDSWEQYYQGIRREWRFGQREAVDVAIVLSEAEAPVAENVWRKEREAHRVADGVIEHMRDFERAEVLGAEADRPDYQRGEASGDGWRMLLGDCVERLSEIEPGSVGLSVHSPPFASLYTYSNSDRDLGNSRDYDQFMAHYRFIAEGVLRATMPGRRACVHVQQVSLTKVVDGVIGWRDFRADVVALWQSAGWVYDGEVVIDKDPQAQAIRTKSKALMFVQKDRDASWLRPAMADYILLFRHPGENAVPVRVDVTNDEWILWARPIWYGIRETETLQAAAARTEKDEKHIAPLQLGTVERCGRLWSMRGETVLDPFAGIGTVPYVAAHLDRCGLGIELKPEYFAQACRNLVGARAQLSLLDIAP